MTKFFVPAANSDEKAEEVWQATVKSLNSQGFDIEDRKIFSLKYSHNGKRCHDVVGEYDRYGMEPILVLLETKSRLFLCCTPTRGVVRGDPILIGKDVVTYVEEFEST